MDPIIAHRIQAWLDGPYDTATKAMIRTLQKTDPKELEEAFFQELNFGTGGMRGKMGIGTHRINRYTIAFASQGLANYLKKKPDQNHASPILIGFDTRHHSREFAVEAAQVFAGNGFHVLLIDTFCPTPLVSFGCRHFQCQAAVMITASHNPPIYNGYKVYWQDGAQVIPPHDQAILEEVRAIRDLRQVQNAPLESPLIHTVGHELDRAYLALLKEKRLCPSLHGASLGIVYTNLHGAALRILPQALATWSFSTLSFVERQKSPDGNFPYAPSPNPEESAALELGIEQLRQEQKDLLIATDPDGDRMGAVAMHQGSPVILTGNQIACLCLFHLASQLQRQHRLPPHAKFIKTIVTTELFRAIAESFGGLCIDVLTGFKYIAEQIAFWEQTTPHSPYLFGAEESYGYLFDTFVRDKDSISSSCLLAEAALVAQMEGKTLVDRLYELYQRHGIHRELLHHLNFPDSPEGMATMKRMMHTLRQHPPQKLGNRRVVRIEDYLHPTPSTQQGPSLPPSDVLRFWLDDKSKLVIRPSGTESKVKLYIEVVHTTPTHLLEEIQACDIRLRNLAHHFTDYVLNATKI